MQGATGLVELKCWATVNSVCGEEANPHPVGPFMPGIGT